MRKSAAPVPTLSECCALAKISRLTSREWRQELCAFVPGSEVAFLLGGELVEPMAHRIEFEARDFLVQVLRNDVDLRLEVLVVRTQIFGGKRLVGEAHVHYGGGVPLGGGKIDEAPFSEQVYLAAILQFIFIDKRANFLLPARQLFERRDINLHIEVPRIANNRSALHVFEVLATKDVLVSRNGDVNVAFLHRFSHRHYSEAVHGRFDALHRVDFRNDHVRPESLGADVIVTEIDRKSTRLNSSHGYIS